MKGKKRFRGYFGITVLIEAAARTQTTAYNRTQEAMKKINQAKLIRVEGLTEDGEPFVAVVGRLHGGSAYCNSLSEVQPVRPARTTRARRTRRR